MNFVMERFEKANTTLPLPKGIVFRALLRAGWKGTKGTLPQELALHLIERSPLHGLVQQSRNGKVTWLGTVRSRRSGSGI